MSQHLVSVSISDPQQWPSFLDAHRELVKPRCLPGRGGWGMAFHRHGEMLTRKAPLNSQLRPDEELLRAAPAQCLSLCDNESALRSNRASMQPLRFRDWGFAMAGSVADTETFVATARPALSGFGLPGPSLPELVCATAMAAFSRARVLDRRPVSSSAYHVALCHAMQRLSEFAGGRQNLSIAMALLIDRTVLLASAGRPLKLHSLVGVRPRSSRVDWRAVVVTDYGADSVEPSGVSIEPWSGLEVTEDQQVVPFTLPQTP